MKTNILITALAFVATAAAAQPATSTKATNKTTTTTTKPMIGATKTTVATKATTTSAKQDAAGNMAVHTTASGKKITYDCSKAGNKNKAACKGK